MLQSVKKFYGNKIGASDGDVGHIKDFYFDDHNWAVRYVVVDTGTWLSTRQVLLSPHAFRGLPHDDTVVLANLTRKKIENSPPIETHKPVSRQHEQDYYQYYGWPIYWQGPEMWGLSAYPLVPPSMGALSPVQPPQPQPTHGRDAHLRSTKALTGYQIMADGEGVGQVTDFMIQDKTWAIRHFVVETGHWFAGKKILIPTRQIESIDWEEAKVFVKLGKKAILTAPEFNPAEPLSKANEEAVFLCNQM